MYQLTKNQVNRKNEHRYEEPGLRLRKRCRVHRAGEYSVVYMYTDYRLANIFSRKNRNPYRYESNCKSNQTNYNVS